MAAPNNKLSTPTVCMLDSCDLDDTRYDQIKYNVRNYSPSDSKKGKL